MKYVVLLRGINIGGRTIKSVELKACFEKAGFVGVQTVLATGNVLVQSTEKLDYLKQKIEKLLSDTFSYPAKVQVIGVEKLREIVKKYPFKKVDDGTHRYVIFTEGGEEKKLAKLSKGLDAKLEAIKTGSGVLYWRVTKGHTLDSDFAKLFAGQVGKGSAITTRNLNTLEKILDKTESVAENEKGNEKTKNNLSVRKNNA